MIWIRVLFVIGVMVSGQAYAGGESAPLADADRDFQKALEIWGDGNSQEAEAFLNRALAIRQEQLGPNDPKVAQVLERLGALSYNRGHYTEAEGRFRTALDVDIKALGEKSFPSAYLMGDLGAALRAERRYSEAQELVEHSIALRRELLRPNDLSIAGGLNNLGRILFAERRYSDARQSLEESLRIYKASLPADNPFVRDDQALLQRVASAEAGVRELRKTELLLVTTALASLAIMIACNLWSEHRHITNALNRPMLFKVAGIASLVGLLGSVGGLGAFAAPWFILTAMPSIGGDSYAMRNIGKLGFLLGAWISAIALQMLTNIGRQIVGLPTQPIAYFRWSAVQPRLPGGDGSITPSAEKQGIECAPDSAPWFAAMEYYALILNRTFKVFVTDQMLCGAKVRGVVANPAFVSPQMLSPGYWTQTLAAQNYESLDVASEIFLRMNSANFQIRWGQISEIEYRAGKKWGMGNVPHSGRLILYMRTGKLRELILLGDQNGNALRARLNQFMKADVVPVAAN